MMARIQFNKICSSKAIVSFLILIVVVLISVRYCDMHDYWAYYLSYSTSHKMTIEVGYTVLAQLFYNLGFPFYVYYGFLMSIAFALVWRFFVKYGKHPALLMILFAVYPFINELQQLRSAVGSAIVLTAVGFLLEKKQKRVAFIIAIAIAMLFHTTTIVYILFLVIINIDIKELRRITAIVFTFGIPLIVGLRLIALKVFPLLPYVSFKYTKYLASEKLVGYAFLLDWVIFFGFFIIYSSAIRYDYYRYSERTQKLIKLSLFVLMLTLLRGLGNNGYRIALMMYPIIYVALSNSITETNYEPGRKALFFVLCAFPILAVCVWWGPLFPRMFNMVQTEMWRVWDYYY